MKLEVIRFANRNCHKYGSQVLYRAVKFSEDNGLDSDPEFLWHTLAQQMVVDNPDTLILAGVKSGKVVAHQIIRMLNYDGTLIAMITQYSIDDSARDGRQELINEGLKTMMEWSRAMGAKKIRCWAMNDKLARLFKKYGFEKKDYVLMDSALEEENGEKQGDQLG